MESLNNNRNKNRIKVYHLMWQFCAIQERPHFSSADVRKDTRNGVLYRAFFEKEKKKNWSGSI